MAQIFRQKLRYAGGGLRKDAAMVSHDRGRSNDYDRLAVFNALYTGRHVVCLTLAALVLIKLRARIFPPYIKMLRDIPEFHLGRLWSASSHPTFFMCAFAPTCIAVHVHPDHRFVNVRNHLQHARPAGLPFISCPAAPVCKTHVLRVPCAVSKRSITSSDKP